MRHCRITIDCQRPFRQITARVTRCPTRQVICCTSQIPSSPNGETIPSSREFECQISWRDLFALVAPYITEHPGALTLKKCMADALSENGVQDGRI